MTEKTHFDAIVIGGGAAGLMCAMAAGRGGRRAAVLEHARETGRKILISGGGRCNFTNLHAAPENFLSANPHFAKSALARYQPADFVALVRKHGIPYHEKTLGQLFCDRTARDIVTMLQAECAGAGVRIVTGCAVRSVRRDQGFTVETSLGEFHAPALVAATGGLSVPKAGATDFAYRLARQFGLGIEPCRPGLTPLLLPGYEALAGASVDVAAHIAGKAFREKMLFTHKGLSGPAILQASSYWTPSSRLRVDLLPGVEIGGEFLRRRGEKVESKTVVAAYLPRRVADLWFARHASSKPLAATAPRELEELAARLHHWEIEPRGTEGYQKAEVTAGGVDTAELSARTFESRKAPGLYFIGEAVDVTGQLGGFNFQWAWASGHAAGTAISES